MPLVTINYLAVLVAAIAAMVIGAVWYSPLLFGKPWMKLMGWSEAKMKEKPASAGKAMAGMAVFALVMAYVLAHFVDYTAATTWAQGVITAFWLWLGFVVTTISSQSLFENRPWGLFWISAAYYLVSLAVMAVILVLWV
ncbi:MAG: DUF1761 domain-containing protein [Candidatus Abawacabacteria bacterium]|nr:DUF1761 domain-containing protein [Candidatus Abawacabacteria bacterium]